MSKTKSLLGYIRFLNFGLSQGILPGVSRLCFELASPGSLHILDLSEGAVAMNSNDAWGVLCTRLECFAFLALAVSFKLYIGGALYTMPA